MSAKRLQVMTEPQENRNPKFTLINPRCKTPTFVDSDGTIIIGSIAILPYLGRFFPDTPENPPSDLSKPEWTQQTVMFHESENSYSIYEPIELLYDAEWEKHRESFLQAYHDIFKELEHRGRFQLEMLLDWQIVLSILFLLIWCTVGLT